MAGRKSKTDKPKEAATRTSTRRRANPSSRRKRQAGKTAIEEVRTSSATLKVVAGGQPTPAEPTATTQSLADARRKIATQPKPIKKLRPAKDQKALFPVWSRLAAGFAVIFALIAGGGGWIAHARLSGAVIASGSLVVERHVKKVQHLAGGIVSEINVTDGREVKAGDVLLKLDSTATRAELGIITSQLTELSGRKARLSAERDGLVSVEFPADFAAQGQDAKRVRAGEVRLFESGRLARETMKQQLGKRVEQTTNEIRALASQRDAKFEELRFINLELTEIRILIKKKLVTITKLYALEREATRLSGELGGLEAQIARAKGQISEIELQILSVDQNIRRDAQREIRDIEAKTADFRERMIAVSDRLKRIDIVAPVSGVIHELAVHTVGGVVTPAEPIMLIVPKNEKLTIEARVSPSDIDQIGLNQPARVRFSAFNQRDTTELEGRVVQVAADVTEDSRTGLKFYLARVELTNAANQKISDLKLVPGMPVEVFITTGERTALSYLAKPVTDQLERAFRDQ